MQDLIPPKLLFFAYEKKRYKIAKGGRGSAKSETIARSLVSLAMQKPLKILCTRAFQNSITDSVHSLLARIIRSNNLDHFFKINQHNITAINGSQFIFSGLQKIDSLKSIDQIDICWIEEASTVTKSNFEKLSPSIRKVGSEIWISFNPEFQDDYIYQTFCANKPDSYESKSVILQTVNWQDNPFFNDTLEQERQLCLKNRPDDYDHIWEGGLKTISEAQIFKNKYEVKEFETPAAQECTWSRYFYGIDWGFAKDPTVLIRAFIKDGCLWVDQEVCGAEVDFKDLDKLFAKVPDYKRWLIKADNARPESISYCKKELNMNIEPVEKGKGSVEDGIEYLKSFNKIIIHPRCTNLIKEARLYCYKVDKHTEEVLPIVVKSNDHSWDALRYALEGYMKKSVSFFDVPI